MKKNVGLVCLVIFVGTFAVLGFLLSEFGIRRSGLPVPAVVGPPRQERSAGHVVPARSERHRRRRSRQRQGDRRSLGRPSDYQELPGNKKKYS
jgi:hypothetical protein